MIRALTIGGLLAFAAMPAGPAVAQPAPSLADPDAGWETYLEIKKLSPDFAARPEKATMAGRSGGWTMWPEAPALPADLRRRVFVNESYLLLSVDRLGKPAGCRRLRKSALPQLDAASCELLMKRRYYSADFLPPDRPRPPEKWVVGVRWERVDPATARRNAARPRLIIVPAAPPSPPKQP